LKPIVKISLILSVVLFSFAAKAQDSTATPKKHGLFYYDSLKQIDLPDVARKLFGKSTQPRVDTGALKTSHAHVSVIPAAGYTLQTGFAAILSGNIAFYNGSKEGENISTILTSLTYSQYKQFIVPLQTNIWSKNGKYNYQSDWRYLKYPSYTYGLGTTTTLDDGYMIDYSYLRLHQNVSRIVSKNLYAGVGIDVDLYWDISEIDPAPGMKTDFESYGLYKNETAVGPTFNLLYDSRRNSINPENGSYINLSYRPKFTFMGSDANWQSLLLEYKGYIKFPSSSDNVLALWSYNWLTFGGKPPYLLLPSTGWDAFVNTGRGFIQGRYRGSDMLYLETEYRFNITSNGLFGGVIFANAETFSSRASTLAGNASIKTFDPIQPGYGLGLRIKLNKFSRTNLCIDYGWGTGGSRGIAVNLGEVF
jgi:outer membrane protein assembly factor BamA